MSTDLTDRCDQDAGGGERAIFQVMLPSGGVLLLCNHHYESNPALHGYPVVPCSGRPAGVHPVNTPLRVDPPVGPPVDPPTRKGTEK